MSSKVCKIAQNAFGKYTYSIGAHPSTLFTLKYVHHQRRTVKPSLLPSKSNDRLLGSFAMRELQRLRYLYTNQLHLQDEFRNPFF
jgi:hypothetical protein